MSSAWLARIGGFDYVIAQPDVAALLGIAQRAVPVSRSDWRGPYAPDPSREPFVTAVSIEELADPEPEPEPAPFGLL